MYKKSFSLIEVLISVSILSVVIVSVLQIKEKNFTFLEKYEIAKKYNEYISLSTIHDITKKDINTNIYLDEIVKFKDDDIRKELKEIKIYIKSELMDTEDLSTDNMQLELEITKIDFKIQEKSNKDFYTFKLNY
jgi:type II secretory pathway pseudopilin PulG